MSINPIPPRKYNGSADPKAYHRFVLEGEAYLHNGKVSKERRICLLAHYLDDKGYNFYMQKVATDDPKEWDLHRFFTELFNYCFPIDYRQQMHIKMENIYQGSNQSVSEYIHELQELFTMVGAMTSEMKVIKLWYSLKPKIQRILWKDGLHPDTSTWAEIVAKAEVIEIADNVVDPQDRKPIQQSNHLTSHRGPSGNNN